MMELWCWLVWRLKRLAWPYYRCDLCLGQHYGCYCRSEGAVAPCTPPERWRVGLRRVLAILGVDSL